MFQLEANFPPEEAKKCLEWIEAVTGERMKTDFGTDKAQAMQCFYESLKDGMALCKWVYGHKTLFVIREP